MEFAGSTHAVHRATGLWEQISNPFPNGVLPGGALTPPPGLPWGYTSAMGVSPDIDLWMMSFAGFKYSPWVTEIAMLRCPSDPGAGLPASGRTNYASCLGDGIDRLSRGSYSDGASGDHDIKNHSLSSQFNKRVQAAQRGAFVPRQDMKFRDITDGLSNTIMYGEIKSDIGDFDKNTMPVSAAAINQAPASGGAATEPKLRPSDGNLGIDPSRPAFWAPEVQAYVIGLGAPGDSTAASAAPEQRRGFKWACGQAAHTVMHTILPPNGPTWAASDDTRRSDMVASAGSRHQGGCHILMGDGAVTFITDSVDTGNQNAGTVFVTDAGIPGVGASPVGSASPYGVWGAMGTRASKEVIGENAL